jgi:hypothetical protein
MQASAMTNVRKYSPSENRMDSFDDIRCISDPSLGFKDNADQRDSVFNLKCRTDHKIGPTRVRECCNWCGLKGMADAWVSFARDLAQAGYRTRITPSTVSGPGARASRTRSLLTKSARTRPGIPGTKGHGNNRRKTMSYRTDIRKKSNHIQPHLITL